MKNRLIAILLAAGAALCARGDTWTDSDTGIEWTYFVSNGEASLGSGSSSGTAVDKSTSGEIVIPSSLGGYPVTSIGPGAFVGCTNLTSVTIPDSVTSIKNTAFQGCRGLTSVTIPNSVTNIYNYMVFYGCSGLTSVTIPQYVLDCQIRRVFSSSYSSITNISYSATITNIGYQAFYNCSRLTSVTIPDSVTSIGDEAFYNCSRLTSVTIPGSVTSIGHDAFCNCNALLYDTTTIPGVKVVDGWAIDHADSLLGSLNLTGIRGVSSYAFSGCSGLRDVTIPDSVTSIGEYAFSCCSGLAGVTIGNGVTSIGQRAFYNCSGLTSVTIPDSVTSIGEYAFSDCNGLTSVTIPDSVTSFSTTAFDGCGKLWTLWYRTLANSSASGGGSPSSTTIVQQVSAPYALTDHVTDRAIASVTVDADCAIDEFVLKDGKVYDCVLRIVNTADYDVTLTLPAGYEYEAFKGTKPLKIPASSRNIITITRTSDRTFLVSREELETVQ